MEWLFYVLKVSVCLALFYGFYHFFLQKFTFFRENRWYLLLSLGMSFIIPLISIEMEREVQAVALVPDQRSASLFPVQDLVQTPAEVLNPGPSVPDRVYDWAQIVTMVYWLVCVVLVLIFFVHVFSLLKTAGQYRRVNGLKVIYKKEGYTNCSFFNYVFVDQESLSGTEIEILLQHEKTHALYWHSLDKILLVTCKIFLWFNPVIYLYDKALEQVHEYEADRETSLIAGERSYANLLLKMAIDKESTGLVHYLVKSPVKDRIKMLFTNPTNHMKKFIYAAVLPLMALLMSGFSMKYIDKVAAPEMAQKESGNAFPDSLRYKQKVRRTTEEKKAEAEASKWRKSKLYKENFALSRQVSGKQLKGLIKGEFKGGSPAFPKKGLLFESDRRTYLLDVAGLTENALHAEDVVLIEVDAAGVSNRTDYVVISPRKIIRNGKTVFLKKKTLAAPFLYEVNRVRFTDGVIIAVNEKDAGNKELQIAANGYMFRLLLKQQQVVKESLVSLLKGDRIRLRFVHELKTGDKSYLIKDWVAISKDIKSYGMMNKDLFDRFYEKLDDRKALTGKLIKEKVVTFPDFQEKINYTAHDSTRFSKDKNTIYLYGRATVQSGDVLLNADEIMMNAKTNTGWAKNALVRMSGETTERFYPSVELKFSDRFYKSVRKNQEP